MANFQTHLTVSTLAGIGYGAAAHTMFQVPIPTCVLAGGLCGLSGMLPDIDSGPGRPLRESFSFAAAVVSTMLIERFRLMGLSSESIVLAAAGVYLLVRFGMATIVERCTVHRGMFHSLPAAAIFGEVAFLLASGDTWTRGYKAGAVVLGYLSHLVLDEVYSVKWTRGGLKKSFGTALKLYSGSLWSNVSCYLKLAGLTFVVLQEPGWMEQAYQQRIERTADKLADTVQQYAQQHGVAPPARAPAPGRSVPLRGDSAPPPLVAPLEQRLWDSPPPAPPPETATAPWLRR